MKLVTKGKKTVLLTLGPVAQQLGDKLKDPWGNKKLAYEVPDFGQGQRYYFGNGVSKDPCCGGGYHGPSGRVELCLNG